MPRGPTSPLSADPSRSAPQDSPEALAISARLTARIETEIVGGDGWIPFSRFMELALYAPGLGYYTAGAAKLGNRVDDGSDFVTAPELTPLFARALARPVAEVLAGGGDTIVELGGGSGRLASDLLLELESLGSLPARYLMLDVSADLRERQAATLRRHAAHLANRVQWLDALPDRLDGVTIGNEVLDALPVDLVVRDGSRWSIRGVGSGVGGFVFADRPLPDALASFVIDAVPDADRLRDGYLTEMHVAAHRLIGTLVSKMTDRSVLLFIDYGFPASEYYHPQRSSGTLTGHRRHRVSPDVAAMPGLQDITAHVDFSDVARAARAAGGMPIGYCSQASFLIDCGIADLIEGSAGEVRRWAPQAAALQTLLSEAEMGELFKVIGLGRCEWALTGFGRGNRLASL